MDAPAQQQLTFLRRLRFLNKCSSQTYLKSRLSSSIHSPADMTSSSTSFARFLSKGSGTGARSGRYPNSAQPGGSQFDTPVVATSSDASAHGITSLPGPSSGINTNNGSAHNQQSSTNVPAGTSFSNLTISSGNSGVANHTSTTVHSAADDHVMIDADGDDEDTTTTRNPDSSSEPRGKESRNPRKRPRKALKNPAPRKAAPRKRAPRKAAPKRAHSEKSVSPEEDPAESAPPKPKGSAKSLKPALFATRAYADSQSLRPPTRLYKTSKSTSGIPISSDNSMDTPLGFQEVRDLLGLLGEQAHSLQAPYFDPGEDTTIIDEQIATGLKISQAKKKSTGEDEDETEDEDEEEDDDEDEEAARRPKASGKKNAMVAYNGLNPNLKPLHKIDEIFADLTENALQNGLIKFLEAFGSRKLKVATLCSGTESPLLALQMVAESERIGFPPLVSCTNKEKASRITGLIAFGLTINSVAKLSRSSKHIFSATSSQIFSFAMY